MRAPALAGLLVALAACGASRVQSPEAAFEQVRLAAVGGDHALLHDALDIDTRWAVATVWQYGRDIAAVVTADYPAADQPRELARVSLQRAAASPRELFRLWAADNHPFAALGGGAEGLGTLARVERDGDRAVAVTSTGVRVPLAHGSDGSWGYAGLRDPFFTWRNDLDNSLKRTRENAAVYRGRK